MKNLYPSILKPVLYHHLKHYSKIYKLRPAEIIEVNIENNYKINKSLFWNPEDFVQTKKENLFLIVYRITKRCCKYKAKC